MTLNQLRYLVELDVQRSFRKAARACGISQPSLSTQISKLESELGAHLFDRSRKPVAPTPLGEIVISQARTVLSETGKIARQVQSRIDASTDELRVAVLPTIATHLLPQLIPRLTHLFPRVAFLFEEALMEEIQERIINHRLDVGIAVPPRATRGLRVEPLYSEALVAYVSEGHRLAGQRTIRATDLALEDLWLPPSGYPLREVTIALCDNANVEVPRPVRYDCGNLETVKRLVEQNQGMAVLPVSAVQGGVFYRSDLVKHFDEPVPDRQVCVVYARTSLKAELIEILAAEIMRAVSSPQISVRAVSH